MTLSILNDAPSGRDLILRLLGPEVGEASLQNALGDLANAMSPGSALQDRLRGFYWVKSPSPGEAWELAEQLGDVMERRAVGECDEPLNE